MILILTSFLAGMLSILAPCVIALIPVLLARSVDGAKSRSPFFIIAGLASSVFLFSILLKSTTLLLDVPSSVWSLISGGIILVFGIITLFPWLWEKVALRFSIGAQHGLAASSKRKGILGDILLGATLGPVFSACSPTYALIVATILPVDPVTGMIYLLFYIAGLVLLLTLIAIFGQKIVKKLGWGVNPNGVFRKVLGVVLIAVGLLLLTGLDKDLFGALVSSGLFDWQINLESGLVSE